MNRLPRTYRFFAGLLAFSMMLAAGVPVLQQVCATLNPGISPVVHSSEAGVHLPCEEGVLQDDAASHVEACCEIDVQQLSDETDGLVLDRSLEQKLLMSTPALTTVLSAEAVDEPHASKTPSEVSSSPVSLHIVHATFLI